MKQYPDSKKQYKIIFLAVLFIIPLVFFYTIFIDGTFAQTADELRDKISDKNKDIENLEKEIESYKKDLISIGKQANTLANAVKELELTRKKLIADITVTEDKIDVQNFHIKELSRQIVGKEVKISDNKLVIQEGIQNINELDFSNGIELFLSKKNFFDSWRETESLREFQSKVKDKIGELKDIKQDLEENKKEEEKAKRELESLKSKLADQKKIVEENTRQEKKLLADTKNKESNYKKILANKETLKKNFEDELRDYEVKLKFILDESSLPGRGVLSWPLNSVYITQKFGKTVAAKRLYASGSHSGVDFRASMGTPVKVVASGTVLGTGDTDLSCPGASFGKWVFIRHENGLSTVYAHLSLIKASAGQEVDTGDIIAYSGKTGHSTAPHLHLTVYASAGVSVQSRSSKTCGGKVFTMPVAALNAYLDPLEYLPSYTSSMVKPD